MATTIVRQAGDDFLSRGGFIEHLQGRIDEIATIPLSHLPAPRVIAVDAPWGFGKSWVAERLRQKLEHRQPVVPFAFIDAFRYDHHDDAFAVIASALVKALNPQDEKKKRILQAAGSLVKVGAPLIARGLAKAATKHIGIDLGEATKAVEDALVDGAGKLTVKGVEELFDHYAKTQHIHEEFQHSLSDLTTGLERPFVVIIDELDRCRPSFALEVLERIKHLFSAENVVFVLFWNAQSIHESIRHTYGRLTEAEAYLAKFVSLSIPLALHARQDLGPASGYSSFIEHEITRTVGSRTTERDDFTNALAEFAGATKASLRAVQRTIYLYRLAVVADVDLYTSDFAFLALLISSDAALYRRVLSSDAESLDRALASLPGVDLDRCHKPTTHIWATLTWLRDPEKFEELNASDRHADSEADAVVLQVMYPYKATRRQNGFEAMGRLIDFLLSSNRQATR